MPTVVVILSVAITSFFPFETEIYDVSPPVSKGKVESRTWVMPQDMKGGRVAATFAGPSQQDDKIDAIFDARATADSGAGG